MGELLGRLRAAVGDAHVLEDPAVRAAYERDWTGRWDSPSLAVVRPGTAEEVRAIVMACAAAGAAIVPQGGNTGLVGGGVPRGGEVVLSLRRLAEVTVEATAGGLIAGAGATLATAQAAARRSGWDVGVDLAARDSATLGGMVATNAGGTRVVRHGAMRAQLLGVEAVLADGSVIGRVPGLAKDNSGFHWPSLLAGSEGTLGIVTRVHVRLVPVDSFRAVAVVALSSVAESLALWAVTRRMLTGLAAVEFMTAPGLGLVERHAGAAPPFRPLAPVCVLMEVAGAGRGVAVGTGPVDNRPEPSAPSATVPGRGAAAPVDALAAALGEAGVEDAVVAADASGIRRLWQLREAHTEAIAAEAAVRGGPVVKLDVTLPLAELAAFAEQAGAVVAEAVPGASAVLFGHLAEGNVHCNVLPPDGGWPDGGEARVEDAVLSRVLESRGSVSSEHGIGVAKLAWVERQRGAADLAAMRAVKQALDPAGILNPGVLLPPDRPGLAH